MMMIGMGMPISQASAPFMGISFGLRLPRQRGATGPVPC